MRSLNVMVAAAAILTATSAAAAADEKPARPKERKVCRTYEEPGRITPKRICRVVPREESPQDARQSPRGETAKADAD